MVQIDEYLYNIDMTNPAAINDNLKIINANKAICQSDWTWKNNPSRRYELNLWLVLKGRGRLETPEKTYDLKGGDCFVFRHWKPHLATHDGNNPLTVPYIVYQYLNSDGNVIKPPRASIPEFYRHIESPAFLTDLISRSISAFDEEPVGQLAAVHWLKSCLLEIAHQDYRPNYAGLELEQFGLIDRICREIRRNPSVLVRVEKLADDVGYTPDHFIRIFKKFKGVTPGEFLIQCRIQLAGEMLKFSSYSLTRISQLLGYSDIYAFSKQFRQKTNQSPSKYRKDGS